MIPVHTYSIVARDSTTGELGVAVQSHYFSVGSVVSWAEPGVGVVATQSFLNLAYGPEGLGLMRGGKSAPEVLAELVARDPEQDLRQVAMVDVAGRSAAHTGAVHRSGGPPGWRRLLGAGQHHGRRRRVAGDGSRLRGGSG